MNDGRDVALHQLGSEKRRLKPETTENQSATEDYGQENTTESAAMKPATPSTHRPTNDAAKQDGKTELPPSSQLRKVLFGGTRFSLLCTASRKQFPVRTTCLKSLLPLLLLLTLPAAAQAQYNYLTNNGAITITRYDCSSGAVTIPSTINGLPVTSIGGEAFENCTNLTSVTIPNNVTAIGNYAFYGCTSLTNVTIPNSVTSIGDAAFAGCTSLTSVTIPESATSIGYVVFGGCTSLSAITVDALNSFYSSVDGVFFNKSQTALILYPGGKAGSYTIPNGVTIIGDYAFSGCTSLTSVTIPKSVTNFWGVVFGGCTSLSAITVEALNSVYSSVDGVLFNKSQATLIQYPGGKAGSYTIPNSVTSIGDYAFIRCTSLTNITIPNSVTNIEALAFYGDTSLTNVTIGNNVSGIGDGAFRGCTSLTSLSIPNSVIWIGVAAFSFCPSITAVYFQGNAPSFGESVFEGDTNATVYYLPGTTGWGTTIAGRPAVLWNPLVSSSDASFGVRTNRFGFTITGANNLVVVVEASPKLADPVWTPVGTHTLIDGSSYFSDPQWTNYPARFYRLRSP
jgi:hypothetical protein